MQSEAARKQVRGYWWLMIIRAGSRSPRTILSAGGYHVQVCQDPRDAVLFLKENPEQIDLVVTDMQMPCLGGIELAAELRKINAALPVLLTSVQENNLTSEELHSLGIRDFVPKPWDRGQLFSIIRQALGEQAA